MEMERGSVSHGTMRVRDLVPAFLAVLPEDMVPEGVVGRVKDGGDEYWESEQVVWDLEELFDLLNDLAPEGCYFGSSEGDGSDYGFWEIGDCDEEG